MTRFYSYDWVIVTNYNFKEFRTMGYDHFRRLSLAELINPRPTSTHLYPEPYYPFDKLKISIKRKTDPSRFCIMTPLCHDKKKMISVTTDNKFISPAKFIIINKYQGRMEMLEMSRVYSIDEPNTMVHHRNMLFSSI